MNTCDGGSVVRRADEVAGGQESDRAHGEQFAAGRSWLKCWSGGVSGGEWSWDLAAWSRRREEWLGGGGGGGSSSARPLPSFFSLAVKSLLVGSAIWPGPLWRRNGAQKTRGRDALLPKPAACRWQRACRWKTPRSRRHVAPWRGKLNGSGGVGGEDGGGGEAPLEPWQHQGRAMLH